MAASKTKAAKAGEMNQEKIAKKRALSLEKQEKVEKAPRRRGGCSCSFLGLNTGSDMYITPETFTK